jgi:hypothetical protein
LIGAAQSKIFARPPLGTLSGNMLCRLDRHPIS